MLPPTPSFATIACILGRGNSHTNSSPPGKMVEKTLEIRGIPIENLTIFSDSIGVACENPQRIPIWMVFLGLFVSSRECFFLIPSKSSLQTPSASGPIASGFPTHEETKLPERL